MTGPDIRGRLGDAALTVVATAIVARVVWAILLPLVLPLSVLLICGSVLLAVMRRR